jgi:hypothetical protein
MLSSSSVQFHYTDVAIQHPVGQLQEQREVTKVQASKTEHTKLSTGEYYKEQIPKKTQYKIKKLKI